MVKKKEVKKDAVAVVQNKLIYVGGFDTITDDQLKKIQAVFGNESILVLMDKDVCGAANVEYLRKNHENANKIRVHDLTHDVANVKKAALYVELLRPLVKNTWFTVKDLVADKIGSYKEIRDILDVLFAFSYIGFKIDDGTRKYKLTVTAREKMIFIHKIIAEKQKEIDDLKEIVQKIAGDVDLNYDEESKEEVIEKLQDATETPGEKFAREVTNKKLKIVK